jgi:cytosine/adenosine deaminase-related metal-dependent hydrolase
MTSLLVRNADVLVTMDEERREIRGGGFHAVDGFITAVGPTSELPAVADRILDLRGHAVIPGLVNTHHHLYQTLTRAVPAAQDAGLFDWLRALYPIWARMNPDAVRVSATLGLAELALSGCTTAFDHLYLFPGGARLDDELEGAAPVGLRFHASRGSMSLGESEGGLPPDSVVEDPERILDDSSRLISAYHEPNDGAMTRIVVAPCSPFSVTPELMRDSAELAREAGVSLHTHLAETLDEEAFCIETFGKPPLAYAEELGWSGPDVWFAHAVHVGEGGVAWMAATDTGAAHCPTSNMRLASGIAPVAEYLGAGVRTGIGVDGSASNDGSHLLAEARQTMLLARLAAAPHGTEPAGELLPARAALEMATRGGAAVLGRDDIGALEAGRCADFAAVRLDHLEYAGALHDPVAALLLCAPVTMDHVYVHGEAVVQDGQLVGVELQPLLEEHNRIAAQVVGG